MVQQKLNFFINLFFTFPKCVLLYLGKKLICQSLFFKKQQKLMSPDYLIVIPARVGSTRLPRKLLEKIGKYTVIEHVIKRISKISEHGTYIATDDEEIGNIAKAAGAVVVMTDANCASGTDRVYQALQKIGDKADIKYVINVQGDMPFIDEKIVNEALEILRKNNWDIVTPVVKVGKEIATIESNVKVVADSAGKALYFSRSPIPHGAEEYLYHVGIYGFKIESLERFVTLKQGCLEKIERLEQLRALENGMNIGIFKVDQIPISIDTMEDLNKAREYYEKSLTDFDFG